MQVSWDGPTLPSLRPKVWVGAGLGLGLGLREGRGGEGRPQKPVLTPNLLEMLTTVIINGDDDDDDDDTNIRR